jgi:SAM-dependent methyltransferase
MSGPPGANLASLSPAAMLTKRFIEKAVERASVAREVSIWWADRKAAAWRRRNPGKPFSDYYADHVRRHLDAGKPHPTLGRQGFTDEVGSKVDWDRSNFAERGRNAWREYRGAGIEPGMRCVDYGCGSLRVGQHAIRFFDRGNYWGIDVSESFIEDGRKLVDPALIEDKRPRLSPITDELIDLIAVWEPQFIFSHTVIQHVPEAELAVYFRRLATMMGPGCKAVIEFIAAPRTKRLKAMSWAYADDLLRDAAAAVDPTLKIRFEPVTERKGKVMKKPRRVMIIERAQVASVARVPVRLAG